MHWVLGILFPPSPYFFPVEGLKSVALDSKTNNFRWFFCFAALVVAGHRHCSSLALHLLLLSVANMYPLFHHHAVRKPHSSPRHAFDPLAVDPLALVVLDEGDAYLDLGKGNLFLSQWNIVFKLIS
ncbi:hypothetical protein AMTR_s00122p00076710 [Amborella trichopoda]|uniref:Uncharacterized protein n=1 Tax=Amborella trichopoda TaxID=13333 RepID=W1NN75_AMBTC|nr:hypothetical protein AMTR_s00122p00076710 [Amborella trichopoda]